MKEAPRNDERSDAMTLMNVMYDAAVKHNPALMEQNSMEDLREAFMQASLAAHRTNQPHAATVGYAQGLEDAATVEAVAEQLFNAWSGNDPHVHCNRMPGWSEISDDKKPQWMAVAKAAIRATVPVQNKPDALVEAVDRPLYKASIEFEKRNPVCAAMMKAFAIAEPKHGITHHPISYIATFADMEKAALAAHNADGEGQETKDAG